MKTSTKIPEHQVRHPSLHHPSALTKLFHCIYFSGVSIVSWCSRKMSTSVIEILKIFTEKKKKLWKLLLQTRLHGVSGNKFTATSMWPNGEFAVVQVAMNKLFCVYLRSCRNPVRGKWKKRISKDTSHLSYILICLHNGARAFVHCVFQAI